MRNNLKKNRPTLKSSWEQVIKKQNKQTNKNRKTKTETKQNRAKTKQKQKQKQKQKRLTDPNFHTPEVFLRFVLQKLNLFS